MPADIFDLSVPDTPPSLNSMGFGGRNAHMKFHRIKKKWEGMFLICLLEMQVPKRLLRVNASAVCRFKTRHKRDEGNFRWMLEKALGDVLQSNGNLSDDTVDEFTFGTLTIDPQKGTPRTVVTLETWR